MKFSKTEYELVLSFWATTHKNAVLVPLDSVAPGHLVVAHLPEDEDHDPHPQGQYWPFIMLGATKKHCRVAGVASAGPDAAYPATLPRTIKVAVLR
jgi:hypothetical protein